MFLEDIWLSDFGLTGKESLVEGMSLAASFSSGRTEPSRDFTGVDWERSAMAYCVCCLLHDEAFGVRKDDRRNAGLSFII